MNELEQLKEEFSIYRFETNMKIMTLTAQLKQLAELVERLTIILVNK